MGAPAREAIGGGEFVYWTVRSGETVTGRQKEKQLRGVLLGEEAEGRGKEGNAGQYGGRKRPGTGSGLGQKIVKIDAYSYYQYAKAEPQNNRKGEHVGEKENDALDTPSFQHNRKHSREKQQMLQTQVNKEGK